jgi:hypothetical protein
MARGKVKLELRKRTVEQKIEFGKMVYGKMNGNSHFISPNPSLLELKNATNKLEKAFRESKHGLLSTTNLNTAEEEWDIVMTAVGDYVGCVARGSHSIIKSAGIDTMNDKSTAPMERVINVEGKMGQKTGEIDWKWKPIKVKRIIYLCYIKEESQPDSEYKLIAVPSKAKCTIKDLKTRVKYCMYVRAVFSAGVGAASDIAHSYAAF